MHWEGGITAAEYGNKVVFESTNCFLCRVVSMKVWGHKFPDDVLLLDEVFDHGGAFVVEDLNVRFEAPVGEVCVDGLLLRTMMSS